MDHRRPAGRGATLRHFVWSLLVALLSGLATTAWAQSNTAVVTGTERVFVRRGPGREFPPFATLTNGSTVEVQEMQGEWSRVTTAGGKVGYVHSNFLALPNEGGPRPLAEASPPQPTPQAMTRPTAHSEPAALNTVTERNKALQAQVGALQEELAALKSHAVQPAAPAPTAGTASMDTDELRAELKRLTAAVEGLQHHAGGSAAPSDAPAGTAAQAEGTERSVSSTALLLGAVGLLVGWLLGAAYGRSQERGRRSRIRF